MGGGQGLLSGFVLPNDCWVQQSEWLLNKTLSALTCGLSTLFLGNAKPGKTLAAPRAMGSGAVPQQDAQ